MKRALCVILMVSMLLSMFTGCSDTSSEIGTGADGTNTDPARNLRYNLYYTDFPTGKSFPAGEKEYETAHNEYEYYSSTSFRLQNNEIIQYEGSDTYWEAFYTEDGAYILPFYHWTEPRRYEVEIKTIHPDLVIEGDKAILKSDRKLELEQPVLKETSKKYLRILPDTLEHSIIELERLETNGIVEAGQISNLTGTYDGGISGMITNFGNITIAVWDKDGNRSASYSLTELIRSNPDKEILPGITAETPYTEYRSRLSGCNYLVDKDGILYIVGTANAMASRSMCAVSPDNELLYTMTIPTTVPPGESVVEHTVTSDGIAGILFQKRSGKSYGFCFCAFDNEKHELAEPVDMPESVTQLPKLAPGFDAYQVTSVGVQGHRHGEQPVMLLNWVDYDIRYSNVKDVKVIDENRIFVTMKDSKTGERRLALFTTEEIDGRTPEILSAHKTELTLAYVAGSSASTVKTVEKYVTEFNIKNQSYRVKMLAYTKIGNQSAEDILVSDIISGKIPDMILFDSDMNYRKFDNLGVFADMYEFMDKDETYSRDAFFGCVKAPFENADGKLPYLTVQFGISTIAASEKIIGSRGSWTISEMIDFADSLGDDRYFVDISGSSEADAPMALLKVLLPNTICHYVDYENAKTTFGGDLAKLLEFCKTANVSLSNNGVPPTMYTDGTVALRAMGNVTSVQTFLAHRHAYYSGDTMNYLGFPTNGDCGSVIVPMTSLAITNKSKNPNGAWEFVTACLDYQREEWVYDVKPQDLSDGKQPMKNPETGFSGVIDTARLMCETLKHYFFFINIAESVDNPGSLAITRSAGGMHFAADGGYGDSLIVENIRKNPSAAFYSITDEDAADLTRLFENITMARSYDSDLLDIIYEDAQYYFNGTKSLDETVRIIENRVGIKLAE